MSVAKLRGEAGVCPHMHHCGGDVAAVLEHEHAAFFEQKFEKQ